MRARESVQGKGVRIFLVPRDRSRPDVQVVSLDSVDDLKRFALDLGGLNLIPMDYDVMRN